MKLLFILGVFIVLLILTILFPAITMFKEDAKEIGWYLAKKFIMILIGIGITIGSIVIFYQYSESYNEKHTYDEYEPEVECNEQYIDSYGGC